MEGAESKLWLMKVPNFLMEHWQACERPTDLGVVAEMESSDGKKSLSLRLSETAGHPADWPREFEVSLEAQPLPMHVFSRACDSQGASKGPVKFDGMVDRRGELKPPLNAEYRALMKSRKAQSANRPMARMMDEDEVHERKYGKLTVRDKRDREAERDEREEKKKAAVLEEMTPTQLRNLVFERFTDQRFWNRKDLELATGRKPTEIKKVLDLIAERVTIGAHKGKYQLKAELRGDS